MDPNTRALIMGAAGAGPATYVEDVFSTWLYTGTSATQTITNGIDLSGKGGLVWSKGRGTNVDHYLIDSARFPNELYSNLTNAQANGGRISSLGSSGYTLSSNAALNSNGQNYVSWTFRKQAKFFDVVTYTGNGSNRTIAHNLGSVPGCIIVKRTDTTGDWQVYHRSLYLGTEYLVLNSTAAVAGDVGRWNNTTPTSTVFSLGTDATVNASGGTYVAYLFAHDAGGFGDSGNDSIIKCGSYVGSTTVDLGFEPQLVIVKQAIGGTGNWYMFDSMRGMLADNSSSAALEANTASAESVSNYGFSINATGFSTTGIVGVSGRTYIYIAIRRGPMKTPTDATKVFDLEAITPSTGASFTTDFPVDMTVASYRAVNTYQGLVQDRLRSYPTTSSTIGTYKVLETNSSAGDDFPGLEPFIYGSDNNTAIKYGASLSNLSDIVYAFRRAPGFFDVVAYTGTGIARTVAHNLGVAPELMIVKSRSGVYNWRIYASPLGPTKALVFGIDSEIVSSVFWNDTSPTSSVFSLGTSNNVNLSSGTYIAYLFASCPGVSKVGSYTGTGTTLSVDCGFTNGARFVLIKRTDSTGDWYVWDTARGIVSGNDPYLLFNTRAAEVTNTDYIDPLSSGFQISSTAPAAINANGGTFIYLAIA